MSQELRQSLTLLSGIDESLTLTTRDGSLPLGIVTVVDVYVDAMALGMRKYLERAGLKVRDVKEILGNKDTSKGVPDPNVQEFVVRQPGLILVTTDRVFCKRAKKAGLKVIFVDLMEVMSMEVLRQIALGRID
ncbi:MAG: hypothetical protein ABSG92_09865 [Conexivisphaerales archaeon]